MVICCDTSFLFALYGNDCHTQAAIDWMKATKIPITFTALNEFELSNALRLAEFRQLLDPGKARRFMDQFYRDDEKGLLLNHPCNLAHVIDIAHRMSESHTVNQGHRAFDLLQVAAALVSGAEGFLTFDAKQRILAEAEGMQVAP